MADAGTATISSTYLFLKLKGGSEMPAKRINFPRSYKQLLNLAKSTFGHLQPINSLLTSEGVVISDISQIIPGDTIYVSSKILDDSNKENDQQNANQVKNDQNTNQVKNKTSKKTEKSIKAAGSFNLLFGTEKRKQANQNDEPNEVLSLSKNEDEIDDQEEEKKMFHSQANDNNDQVEQEKSRTKPKPKGLQQKQAKKSNDQKGSESKTSNSAKKQTKDNESQISKESESKNRIKMSPAGSRTNSKYDDFLEDNDNHSKSQNAYDEEGESNADDMANSTNQIKDNSSISSKSQNRKTDISRTAPIQPVTSLDSDASSNARRNKRSQIPKASQTVRAPSVSDTEKDAASTAQQSITLTYHSSWANASNAPSVASGDNSDQEEGVEPGNEKLQNLIDETVEPGTLQNVLDETLEQMPDYANPLRKLPDYEHEQRCYWYREGLILAENQHLPPLPDDVFGIDDMIGKVRCILMDHRFSERSGSTYRLNLGIVGPQGSGKSVFLRVFLEELFADLITTDEWKNTFIFMQDLTNIVSYAISPIQFYRAFLKSTLDSLTWARPTLMPYIGVIYKMFEDVTSLKSAPRFNMAFSLNPDMQRYAAELQTIINKLSLVWNDEQCLYDWINSIVYLPIIISQAFGFKKCIYVLDHYDFADTVFNPSNSKFGESPSAVSLIDVFNSALMHCNFIVSCSNQRNFLCLTEQFPGEEAIKPKMEIVSTIGLIQEATHEDQQISITFIDDTFPTVITCDACGGIPLFQYHWNAINEAIDNLENEEEEEDQEELNDVLNIQVQNAMKYFFVDEDGEQRIHEVTSVKRKTIQKKNDDE